MILDSLFGGGNQSSSSTQPSSTQPSSPSQPSGGDAASGSSETTEPPTGYGDADPIYDEAPGETDDGTYTGTVPSDDTTGETVTPPTEPEAAAAPAPQPEADEPVAAAPAEPQATSPAPAAGTPAPAASAAATPAPAAPVATDDAAETGVTDFVTPLLAELSDIRKRHAEQDKTADDKLRQRALDVQQENATSRLFEVDAKETETERRSLLADADTAAEKPVSKASRWYEAA